MSIKTEFLMNVLVDVGVITSLGAGPVGERRLIAIDGGTFEGSGLKGKVLAGGNDWQVVHPDSMVDLEARYALGEDSGAMIHVISRGLRHGSPEVMAALARGEEVDPAKVYFRSVLRFETGDAKLKWLNSTIGIAHAVRRARRVELAVYKLL